MEMSNGEITAEAAIGFGHFLEIVANPADEVALNNYGTLRRRRLYIGSADLDPSLQQGDVFLAGSSLLIVGRHRIVIARDALVELRLARLTRNHFLAADQRLQIKHVVEA